MRDRFCTTCESRLRRRKGGGFLCPICRTIKPPYDQQPMPTPFVVYSDLPKGVGEPGGIGGRLRKIGGEVDPDAVGALAPSVDHVIARAKGGPDAQENLRLAHRCCNEHRGSEPLAVQRRASDTA